MLGFGCGVFQYPQFYDKDLDMHQVLPHPYLGSFYGGPGDNTIKKMGVRLGKSSITFCLKMY